MAQFPYDPGLSKSRFTQGTGANALKDVDIPVGTATADMPDFINDPLSPRHSPIEIEADPTFFNELKNATIMMRSLYEAIFPLDPEVADKLLKQALLDLRNAVCQIAADFSLGINKSLSKRSRNKRNDIIQNIIVDNPHMSLNAETELKLGDNANSSTISILSVENESPRRPRRETVTRSKPVVINP